MTDAPETRRTTLAMTLMYDVQNAHDMIKKAFEHAHATNEAAQQQDSNVREIVSHMATGLSAMERALKLTK